MQFVSRVRRRGGKFAGWASVALASAILLTILSSHPATAQTQPRAPSLLGKWRLESWTYGFRTADSTLRPWVAFKPGGVLEISDGCFLYSSHYTLNGKWVSIDPPRRTGGGCPPPHDRYYDAMTGYFAVSLAGNALTSGGGQWLTLAVGGDNFHFKTDTPTSTPPPEPAPAAQSRLLQSADFRGSPAGAADECATHTIQDWREPIIIACTAVGGRLRECMPVGTTDPVFTQFAACFGSKIGVQRTISGPVRTKLRLKD
jgi:hypothetical protein